MTVPFDGPTSIRADVVVYGRDVSNEARRIDRNLAGVGVAARVAIVEPLSPDGALSWLMLASVPLRLLHEQLAARLGESGAAEQMAKAIEGLARGEAEAIPGLVLLQDTETGLEVILPPGLPEKAFRSLAEVDLASYTFGPLHYDAAAARWRSVVDEWTRQGQPPKDS